jgi:SAM-dependent methyltransferase
VPTWRHSSEVAEEGAQQNTWKDNGCGHGHGCCRSYLKDVTLRRLAKLSKAATRILVRDEIESLVDGYIEQLRSGGLDVLDINDQQGEYAYSVNHRLSYIRTIRDIKAQVAGGSSILEIGAFLGTVTVPLARLGYSVVGVDIPEFYSSTRLQDYFRREQVRIEPANLRSGRLPFEDAAFDAIILCETLEHWNFNPLPAIQELNRVLRPEGIFYVAMPNLVSIHARARFLLGRSPNNPIEDFFLQLDRRENMVVGLHWREYTMDETCRMLTLLGFEVISKYFFAEDARRLKRRIAYLIPSWRPTQVVVARKTSRVEFDFWRTDANS